MIRLFISEWNERCDWPQTTAEHDVVWSIWAGDHGELSCARLNGEYQFTWNLTGWAVRFGLSSWLITRSSTAMHRLRSTAAWLADSCSTRLVDCFQQILDVSNSFTQQPSCTISYAWTEYKFTCVCVSVCVRHTFRQLAYRSDPLTLTPSLLP